MDFWYIWEKYRSSEITSGIIFKRNLLLYKGFTLKITYKWWPLTTLNRWPLYQIKIYSKLHRESMKDTVMSRWPLYKGDRCDRFDCICIQEILSYFCHCQKTPKKTRGTAGRRSPALIHKWNNNCPLCGTNTSRVPIILIEPKHICSQGNWHQTDGPHPINFPVVW